MVEHVTVVESAQDDLTVLTDHSWGWPTQADLTVLAQMVDSVSAIDVSVLSVLYVMSVLLYLGFHTSAGGMLLAALVGLVVLGFACLGVSLCVSLSPVISVLTMATCFEDLPASFVARLSPFVVSLDNFLESARSKNAGPRQRRRSLQVLRSPFDEWNHRSYGSVARAYCITGDVVMERAMAVLSSRDFVSAMYPGMVIWF